MKKNLLIASILGSICLVCALLIALIDIATKDKIAQNTRETELATIKEIFENYDDSKSKELESSGNINKKIQAFDSNNNELNFGDMDNNTSFDENTLEAYINEPKKRRKILSLLEAWSQFKPEAIIPIKCFY